MSDRENYERLLALSLTNPIVRAHLTMYHRGGVPWQVMLESLAISLADANASLFKVACDAKAREMPDPNFILRAAPKGEEPKA